MTCVFESCCGCSLRTGCLIIGYLELVAEIFGVVFCLVFLVSGMDVAAHGEDEVDGHFMKFAVIALLVAISFMFVPTILLLVGVCKNKCRSVKAYLTIKSILLVMSLISALTKSRGIVIAFPLSIVIAFIIIYILKVFFLLVVRSYYYKMDDGKAPTVKHTA